MSITKDFENRYHGAGTVVGFYLPEDVNELLAHTRALETMLKWHEWTPWDGTSDPVYCRSCHGNIREGHKPECKLSKLLEGVE